MRKQSIPKKKIKNKNIFSPVKEHLEMLLEYIELLEMKKKPDLEKELVMLIGLMITIKQQCLIYLNNEIKYAGKNNGNYKL